IGDAIPLVRRALAHLRAQLARPVPLPPGELPVVGLLRADQPSGGPAAALLLALRRGALAFVDGALTLVGEPFALVRDPLALVGQTGPLVGEALEVLERGVARSLAGRLLPEIERVRAGQPLTRGQHLLALAQQLLALLRDPLALGRDALALRGQL